MSEIQRYDPVEFYDQGGSGMGHMQKEDDGDYYLCSDVDSIINRVCQWRWNQAKGVFNTGCRKIGGIETAYCSSCGGKVEVVG